MSSTAPEFVTTVTVDNLLTQLDKVLHDIATTDTHVANIHGLAAFLPESRRALLKPYQHADGSLSTTGARTVAAARLDDPASVTALKQFIGDTLRMALAETPTLTFLDAMFISYEPNFNEEEGNPGYFVAMEWLIPTLPVSEFPDEVPA